MQKKKVTIQDIAEKANVSKSTVSRVLNKSTLVKEHKRLAVLDAMKQLDFQPNQMARSLAGGRSMTIGVLTQDIGSPFYDLVARGVTSGLQDTQYSPIFVDGQWNAEVEEAAIDTLLGRRVDGIIAIGGNMTSEDLRRVNEQKPLLIVAREIPDWKENCIFIDNFRAAYEATKYLVDLGHKDIAFISGISAQPDSQARQKGFEQALRDAGIQPNPDLIVEGDFRPDSGVTIAESLLDSKIPFSAIFASNDEMAFGVRLTLYRREIRVPEDISLIGFDDQHMSAFMNPPLTTVRQPAIELGSAAACAMINKLDDQPFEIPQFTTELVIRESVAKI